MKKQNVLKPLFLLAITFFYLNSVKIVNAQENNCFEDDDISVSITSPTSNLTNSSLFLVSLKIENRSNKGLPLNYLPKVILTKGGVPEEEINLAGNSFYSNAKLNLLPTLPKKNFLESGESLMFEIEISKLKWAKVNSSFRPSNTIFELASQGDYYLQVDILVRNYCKDKSYQKSFSSNKLKISLND